MPTIITDPLPVLWLWYVLREACRLRSEPHENAAQIVAECEEFFDWFGQHTGQQDPTMKSAGLESEEMWLTNAEIAQLLFSRTEQQLREVGTDPPIAFYRVFAHLALFVAKGESDLAEHFHDQIYENM